MFFVQRKKNSFLLDIKKAMMKKSDKERHQERKKEERIYLFICRPLHKY